MTNASRRQGDDVGNDDIQHVWHFVYSLARRRGSSPSSAEDISQIVVIEYLKHRATLAGAWQAWAAWLSGCRAIDSWRQAHNDVGLDSEWDRDPGRDPEEEAWVHQLREALIQALEDLPADQRDVIVLKELKGLSMAEVSEVLGVSEGTLWSRLRLGKERLRDSLVSVGPIERTELRLRPVHKATSVEGANETAAAARAQASARECVSKESFRERLAPRRMKRGE